MNIYCNAMNEVDDFILKGKMIEQEKNQIPEKKIHKDREYTLYARIESNLKRIFNLYVWTPSSQANRNEKSYFFIRITEECLLVNERNHVLTSINKIKSNTIGETDCIPLLSNSYYYSENEDRNNVLKTFAINCVAGGDRKNAIKAISRMVPLNDSTRTTLLLSLVDDCFRLGDRENELLAVMSLPEDLRRYQTQRLIDLEQHFCKVGDRENEWMAMIHHSHEYATNYLINAVEKFSKANDQERAFRTIVYIKEKKIREEQFLKLA